MSRARNLADLLDANGDVASGALDNVPPSNDASALTTGTLPIARIADGDITAAKLGGTLDLSGKTLTMPAGSVIQFQYLNDKSRNQVAISSTSYVDTGLGLSITPKFSDSLIKIDLTFLAQYPFNGAGGLALLIYRDSTPINDARDEYVSAHNMAYYAIQNSEFHVRENHSWVDAPNTTSEVTYKLYARSYTGSAINLFNGLHQYVHFSLMEIAQ